MCIFITFPYDFTFTVHLTISLLQNVCSMQMLRLTFSDQFLNSGMGYRRPFIHIMYLYCFFAYVKIQKKKSI